EAGDLAIEGVPGRGVGLGEADEAGGGARPRGGEVRLLEDDHDGDDGPAEEPGEPGPAQADGHGEPREGPHQKVFLSPPKNPRGGPNCLAKTPTPVPSRST